MWNLLACKLASSKWAILTQTIPHASWAVCSECPYLCEWLSITTGVNFWPCGIAKMALKAAPSHCTYYCLCETFIPHCPQKFRKWVENRQTMNHHQMVHILTHIMMMHLSTWSQEIPHLISTLTTRKLKCSISLMFIMCVRRWYKPGPLSSLDT